MHTLKLENRKIKKGSGDLIVLNLDDEYVLESGIIEREPIDITDWRFTVHVHRNVEYSSHSKLFSVKGVINNGANGMVYFEIPDEYTDVAPRTYWYTLQYIKPNGKVYRTLSAKYIIAESLNDYFSIYKQQERI